MTTTMAYQLRLARCVTVVLVASWLSVAKAEAPPATTSGDVAISHEHFNRGVEYVHDGDLKGALIEFKRAYAVSPNYRVLYNLGQVANAIGKYTDAQSYFQRYLSEGRDEIPAERRHDVEAQLAKLAGRIANLTIASNVDGAQIYIDDVAIGKSPLPASVRVSSGTRTISATVAGRPRVTQVVEVAGGDSLTVRLSFPPLPKQEPMAAAVPEPLPPTQPYRTEPASSGNPALWLGIASGVLAAGAGVMGYLTLRDAEKYDDAVARKTTLRELEDLDSRTSTKALVTDVLLAATAIGAGVTLFVALQGGEERETPPQASRPRRAPISPRPAQLSLGAGSLHLHGEF